MRLLDSFVTLAIATQAAFAGPIKARTPYAVKETHNPPRQWSKLGRANGAQKIHLQIGLRQGRFDELERHLYEVSDPDHARYGNHLSHEEVNDLVKPSEDALELVHEWLAENGVNDLSYSAAKDWVVVTIPVEVAERLLDTEYSTYKHEDGTRLVRTSKWSLPLHLHEHIDAIQPTTSFFRTSGQRTTLYEAPPVVSNYQPPSNATIAKVCNVSSVTPECFATLYQTKNYKPQAAGENKVGFANYLGEIPIRPDTKKFLQKYRPEAVSTADTYTQNSIAGGPVQDGPLTYNQSTVEGISKEANLDVQAIAGISWPTPIESWSTGGEPPFIPDLNTPDNTNEPYLVWVNYILNQTKIPQVISTSYGDDEQSVPQAYAERVCRQFAQVGARGTSLLFSSGDHGVGNPGTCLTNDGKNTTQFLPAFPAGCPYVTAVGGVQNFEPEIAVYRAPYTDSKGVKHGLYSSGSGFSNYFSRPKYQKEVVDDYVESLGSLYDGLYNKTGRGYPDISAQSLYFAYFWNGTEGVISGTSASCPLSSGILSLVNDALIASGKKPLGFLNPWLYSKGYKGFTDIVNGSSHGCDTDGFPTAEGWDPVTGFGTPIFPKLVKLAGADYGHN